MKRFLYILVVAIALVVGSVFLPGCAPQPEVDVVSYFAKGITDTVVATHSQFNSEMEGINNELTVTQTRIFKVEQVVTPALDWIEFIKDKAERERWGGGRVLQVTKDLTKFQNDEYRVVKLELVTTMISAGLKFEPTILIEDLKTGQVTKYEDLSEGLKAKFAALQQQREAKVKQWELVKSTAIAVIRDGDKWQVSELDARTYQIYGHGLGWSDGLTRGKWYYYTDTGAFAPVDASAQALEKVLKGS